MAIHNEEIEQAFLQQVQRSEERALYWGWGLILTGFGGFLLWALLAPLDKGVPINGTLVVSGNRKTIQHPEGGIIEQIKVHDGDNVAKGEVLLTLNAVKVRSITNGLTSEYHQLLVNEARLLAEQHGQQQLRVTPALQQARQQVGMDEALALQQQLLKNRRQALQLESDRLNANIAGLQATLGAQKQILASKKSQKKALSQQLAGLISLAGEHYFPRNKMLESQQTYAQLDAEIAQISGEILRIGQEVEEKNILIQQHQQEYQKEVNSQLITVQSALAEVTSQLEKANFDLAKVQVRSPVAGTVVGMNVFTEGGVVAAGQSLMEIMPDDQPLLVDARIPVDQVDNLHPGLAVELEFTAFNQRTTPKVTGRVTWLSADRLVDERTQEPYYRLQVAVGEVARQKLGALSIKPGMPVQGLVRTGERSMINYLFKPLMDRLPVALTEE